MSNRLVQVFLCFTHCSTWGIGCVARGTEPDMDPNAVPHCWRVWVLAGIKMPTLLVGLEVDKQLSRGRHVVVVVSVTPLVVAVTFAPYAQIP